MATSTHETKFVLSASDKTKAAIKSAEAGFKGLDGMVSKLAVGFAGLAGAGGIGILINSQVNAARQAQAYSAALGMNIADLTRWQAASETVGIGADKMADIFKDTAEKIGDAYRNGAGEAKEAVETLGLSLDSLANMSPDQQLLAIANAMQNVQTQGEKIQIMEALASDAALLLPLLDNNAEKLRELTQLADATGRTLTQVESDKLIKAGEAMNRLSMSAEGLGQTLAVHLAEPLAEIIDYLNVGIPSAINWASSQINSLQISNITNRIESAQEKINELTIRRNQLEQEHAEILASGVFKVAGLERVKQDLAEQTDLVNRLNIELEQLRSPADPLITVSGNSGGSANGAGSNDAEKLSQSAFSKMEQGLATSIMTRREMIMNSYLEEQEMIDQAETLKLETLMGYDELRMQSHYQMTEAMMKEDEKAAKARAQLEGVVQNKIASLKQMGMAQGVGILRMLAQEHEGFAYAAIAVEKALAIASINIEANKAHMAAYGLLQAGLLGPGLVSAMHTQIEASRSFATGMTVAAGLFEASQVGRGGGGGGGGAIPVTPVQSPTNLAPINSISAPEQGNQITIVIKGEGPFDDMVRNSVETLSNNDELVIVRG